MAYLTNTLLKARVGGQNVYIELTDDNADGTADNSVETMVLDQVDQQVNGYFRRGGYTIPLAVTDAAQIMYLLLDIANYKLKTRGNREATEDDRKLYGDALKTLEMYATGELSLPSVDTAAPTIASMVIDSPEDGPFFNRITLCSF